MTGTRNDPQCSPIEPVLVGWKEYIDFPDWHLKHIKVKIDTGARTSALDVLSYELRESAVGMNVIFRLAPRRTRDRQVKVIEVPVVRMAVVCNSSGMREQRRLGLHQLGRGQVGMPGRRADDQVRTVSGHTGQFVQSADVDEDGRRG